MPGDYIGSSYITVDYRYREDIRLVVFFVIVNGQKYSGQFHFQSIDLFNLDVFQIMRMIFYLFLFFSIILKLSIGNDEFDRLPTPLAEHRYFVYCNNDYKLLGSCTNIDNSVPISRCVVRIGHQYQVTFLSSIPSEENVGTGTIVSKSNENDQRSITIVTCFHVIVPKFVMNLPQFIVAVLLLIVLGLIPGLIFCSSTTRRYKCYIFCAVIAYVIICSPIVYYLLVLIYPFLSNSSFEIRLPIAESMDVLFELSQLNCELISSRLIFSSSWSDDIGKRMNYYDRFWRKFNVENLFV